MFLERLIRELSAIHPVNEDFIKALEAEFTPLSLPKNYMLLEAPKICDYAWFLNRGAAMSYTYTDGRKDIEWLWKPGQLVVSVKSFYEQVPSREFIQLFEQSEVLCISRNGVSRLCSQFPEASHIYHSILNKYYELSRKRIRDLRNLTGAERYHNLLASFNNIEQVLSQENIASYLGITPQSLSRIKRKSH